MIRTLVLVVVCSCAGAPTQSTSAPAATAHWPMCIQPGDTDQLDKQPDNQPDRQNSVEPPEPAPSAQTQCPEPAPDDKPKGKMPRLGDRTGPALRESGWYCFEVTDPPIKEYQFGICWREKKACEAVRTFYAGTASMSECELYSQAYCYTEYNRQELYSRTECYLWLGECMLGYFAASDKKHPDLLFTICRSLL